MVSRRARVLFTIVAVLQVVGGLIGFWYLGTHRPWGDSSVPSTVGARGTVWVVFLVLYVAAVVAGVLLIFRQRPGQMVSAFVQALQVPSVSVLGLTYSFVVGAGLVAELRWPGPETYLSWILGSQFALFVGGKGVASSLGVNALALLLLILTFPWRHTAGAKASRDLVERSGPSNDEMQRTRHG